MHYFLHFCPFSLLKGVSRTYLPMEKTRNQDKKSEEKRLKKEKEKHTTQLHSPGPTSPSPLAFLRTQESTTEHNKVKS